MEVISGSWRSDLALAELRGARVEHHPTYVAVRPADLLLLRRTPLRRDLPKAIELFHATFPDARRVTIGIDDPTGEASDLDGLGDLGYTVTASVVLTADRVQARRRADDKITVRKLGSDDDWAARADLRTALHRPPGSAVTERELAASGLGTWFGVFDHDRLLVSAGVVVTSPGLARFGAMDLHPTARGRGLAALLVETAGAHAREALAADHLMIVAEPGHEAIGMYERLGFRHTESQLQAQGPVGP